MRKWSSICYSYLDNTKSGPCAGPLPLFRLAGVRDDSSSPAATRYRVYLISIQLSVPCRSFIGYLCVLLLFLAPGSMNVDNCRYYPYIDLLFSFPAQLDSVHEKY